MTKADLADEIKKLTTQLEQAMANVHAINGAIQFAGRMLDKLDLLPADPVPPSSDDH